MDTWIALSDKRPEVGEWILMYLPAKTGMEKYRAGMYMGPDDWMSSANWTEPNGLLNDFQVSHWMPLSAPPRS